MPLDDVLDDRGFFSSIKEAIANLFIPPPKVTKRGEHEMKV